MQGVVGKFVWTLVQNDSTFIKQNDGDHHNLQMFVVVCSFFATFCKRYKNSQHFAKSCCRYVNISNSLFYYIGGMWRGVEWDRWEGSYVNESSIMCLFAYYYI